MTDFSELLMATIFQFPNATQTQILHPRFALHQNHLIENEQTKRRGPGGTCIREFFVTGTNLLAYFGTTKLQQE